MRGFLVQNLENILAQLRDGRALGPNRNLLDKDSHPFSQGFHGITKSPDMISTIRPNTEA